MTELMLISAFSGEPVSFLVPQLLVSRHDIQELGGDPPLPVLVELVAQHRKVSYRPDTVSYGRSYSTLSAVPVSFAMRFAPCTRSALLRRVNGLPS
jgi:hypothetical protein